MNTTVEKLQWRIDPTPIDYQMALDHMHGQVDDIIAGRMGEQIWLCEHPPVYTMGTSAEPSDLINPPFDVIHTGRGGQVTYHGPGQRVVYAMLDLNRRAKKDLHGYIHWLQSWGQRALAEIGIKTIMRDDRIGLWVPPAKYGLAQESKIMAVGVRVKKWVTYHGMAINVNPDLSHFDGIIPCGIRDYGVTSVGACGIRADMDDLDQALRDTYLEFGMD